MQNPTIQQAMNMAGQMFGSGRIAEAEQIYRQVIKQDPNHADAAHCLGVIAHQKGQMQDALELVRRATIIAPGVAIYRQNLGDLLLSCGDLAGAEAELDRAVELDPRLPVAVMKLGLVREHQDRLEEAVQLYRRAIALAPNYAEAHCNLGDALVKLQQESEAVAHYDQAIRLNPRMFEAHANRAVALDKLGRIEEAVASSLKALELNPNLLSALIYVGRIYQSKSHDEQAYSYFQRAAQLHPDSAEAHSGLSMIHMSAGRYEQAIEECRLAIRCDPRLIDPYPNLALCLSYLGRYEEAITAYDAALKIHSDRPTTRANRALLLLLRGNLADGLKEYEWRWETNEFKTGAPPLPMPKWDGSDLAGKSILLWHEQGIGDTIQFIRYAKLLAQKGARVVAGVQEPLRRVMQGIEGVAELLAGNDLGPMCDFHLPMMSLPHLFRTTLDTIPADVPYIRADPGLVEQWRQRIDEATGRERAMRIGICWKGGNQHKLDRERSARLEHFRPLAAIAGIKLFSLQLGQGAEQAKVIGPELNLIDLTGQIADFADTTALIENLDLVISVDTALIHLAGAMGRPVWNLLQFSPDFRWLLDREDTPWYPTMRLFRQPNFRDWPGVFTRVVEQAVQLVQSRVDR